jgi:hypothetical protein
MIKLKQMSKRSQSAAIIISMMGAVVAVVAVTVAMASESNYAVPRVTVSARLGRTFGVLRRHDLTAHSASANASAQPLPVATEQGINHFQGMDPSAAVFAGGTYPTWVVPGSSDVCLVLGATAPDRYPGGVCGSISGAERRGLAVTTENAAGAPIVVGLAPNGNSAVEVTNTNGTTESVPVTNNVYEITSGNPTTVSLKDASGTPTTRHVAVLSSPSPASAASVTP